MKNFGYVLATKMLVDGKRKVRFMYRETPDNNQDSGWRFFCGDENDEFVYACYTIAFAQENRPRYWRVCHSALQYYLHS